MSTLRAIQSSADNQNAEAPMTWQALNVAASNMGAPTIDYDRFAARWETDPILKKLVDRFDSAGVVIKTDDKATQTPHKEREGIVDRTAKAAARRHLGK